MSLRALVVLVLALAVQGLGCGGSSPTAPSPTIGGGQPAGTGASVASPVITSISPNTGVVSGGTLVQLLGTGLDGLTRVTFGGVAASNISWSPDGTLINATAPPHAAGPVDVSVTNRDGQTGSLPGGFTYGLAAPLTLERLSTTAGLTAGGRSATLRGSGFQAGTRVTLGDVEGRLIWTTSTTVDFTTPPHAPGTVAVVVTTPDGQTQGLAGGFTYARPQFVDFNGDWEGHAGVEGETPIRFAVRGDVLVSFTCGGGVTFSVSSSTRGGEFSVTEGTVRITGGLLQVNRAEGTIDIAACMRSETAWSATKRP